MIAHVAQMLNIPILSHASGGGASAWPPPIVANLIHAWDARTADYLTLSGSDVLALAPVVGNVTWTSAGAGDPSTPTWGALTGIVFDSTDDVLVASTPATSSTGEWTLIKLLRLPSSNLKGTVFSMADGSAYGPLNVGSEVRYKVGGTAEQLDDDGSTAAMTHAQYIVVALSSDGNNTDSYVYEDGVKIGFCNNATDAAFSTNRMGLSSLGSAYAGGLFALGLLYDTNLSQADIQTISTWILESL